MKTMKPVIAFTLLIFIFLLPACKKDDSSQAEKDEETIQTFLKSNNLTNQAKSTGSGLYYVIEKEGFGAFPTPGVTVIIHYKGTLLEDGAIFDSSYERGSPATIALNNTIKGWQEGVPLFKRGGKGMLIIPSALAYGASGKDIIPPNAVLLFEIELIDFI